MGDLQTQQEVPVFSDAISTLLSEIGKVEEVCPELIKSLSSLWDTFKSNLDENKTGDIYECCRNLFKFTASAVLDVKYGLDVEESLQQLLSNSIKKVESGLAEFPNLKRACASLSNICADPLISDSFEQLQNFKNLSVKEIDELWSSEGTIFLQARLEILGRPKKWKKNDVMLSILQIFLLKGKEWFGSERENETDQDEQTFNPYRLTFQTYLEYLEAYILFWCKFNEEIEVNIRFITDLTPEIISTVINNMKIKSCETSGSRLVERLWKNNWKKKLLSLFTYIVPEILGRKCDIEGVRAVLGLWVDSLIENTDSKEQITKFDAIATHLFAKVNVQVSDYFYSLAEIIKEKFGDSEESRQQYILYFGRAIPIDLNVIGDLQAENPANTSRLSEEYHKLSFRYLQFANFFEEFPKTAHKLRITAFSLNPNQELFDQLFTEENAASSNATSSPEENSKSVAAATSSSAENNCEVLLAAKPSISVDYNKADDLRLPYMVREDFFDILYKPRWGALGHNLKWDELRTLCKKLLDEGKEFLVKTKELEFVNVDFKKYENFPLIYDPNDDGIEKGFYHPDKPPRRRMLNGAKKGNNVLAKRLVKNSKQARIQPRYVEFRSKNTMKISNHRAPPPKQQLGTGQQKQLIQLQHYSGGLSFVKQFENSHKAMLQLQTKKNVKYDKQQHKEVYINRYLSQRHQFPKGFEILYPTTQKNSVLNNKSRNGMVRQPPTRYDCPSLMFQQRLRAGLPCEIELTVGRSAIASASTQLGLATTTHQPMTKEKIPRLPKDIIPKTCEEDWTKTEASRNTPISSRILLTGDDKKKLSMQPRVDLNTRIYGVPDTLKNLTVEYFKLRRAAVEEESQKKEHLETPVQPDPLFAQEQRFGFAEKSKKKKALFYDSFNKVKVKREPEEPFGETGCEENHTELHLQNFAEYEFGAIWETELVTKTILPPRGPKNKQDEYKRTIMLQEAFERIRNNLELKTYRWKTVVEKAKKDDEEEKIRITVGSRILQNRKLVKRKEYNDDYQPIAREFVDRTAPCTKANSTKTTKSYPSEFQGAVSVKTNARKRELKSTNKIVKPRAACDTKPDRSSENGDVGVLWDQWFTITELLNNYVVNTSTIGASLDENEVSDESGTESSNSSKRNYQYYPDHIINKAIIAMLQGKTMKEAAELNNIGRSALCKRLHVKGLRKNGKLVLPDDFYEQLNTNSTKMLTPPPFSKLLPIRHNNHGRYDIEQLDGAIGAVLFRHGKINQVAKEYKIPPATISKYVTRIKSVHGPDVSKQKVMGLLLGIKLDPDEMMTEAAGSCSISTSFRDKKNFEKAIEMMNQGATALAASLVCRVPLEELQAFCKFINNDSSISAENSKQRSRNSSTDTLPISCLADDVSCQNPNSKSFLPLDEQPCSSSSITSTPVVTQAEPEKEVEVQPAKPALKITFPILHSKSVQKISEEVSGIPSREPEALVSHQNDLPKLDPPMLSILDDENGQIVEIPDPVQVESWARDGIEFKSCPLPQQKQNVPNVPAEIYKPLDSIEGVKEVSLDQSAEKIPEKELPAENEATPTQPIKTLSPQHVDVIEKAITCLVPAPAPIEQPKASLQVTHQNNIKTTKCYIRLDRDEVENFLKKQQVALSRSSTPEEGSSSLSNGKRLSVRITQQSTKLDFTTGTVLRVPVNPSESNNTCTPPIPSSVPKRNLEENGNDFNHKRRKVEKENVPKYPLVPKSIQEHEMGTGKNTKTRSIAVKRINRKSTGHPGPSSKKSCGEKRMMEHEAEATTESETDSSDSEKDDKDPDYVPEELLEKDVVINERKNKPFSHPITCVRKQLVEDPLSMEVFYDESVIAHVAVVGKSVEHEVGWMDGGNPLHSQRVPNCKSQPEVINVLSDSDNDESSPQKEPIYENPVEGYQLVPTPEKPSEVLDLNYIVAHQISEQVDLRVISSCELNSNHIADPDVNPDIIFAENELLNVLSSGNVTKSAEQQSIEDELDEVVPQNENDEELTMPDNIVAESDQGETLERETEQHNVSQSPLSEADGSIVSWSDDDKSEETIVGIPDVTEPETPNLFKDVENDEDDSTEKNSTFFEENNEDEITKENSTSLKDAENDKNEITEETPTSFKENDEDDSREENSTLFRENDEEDSTEENSTLFKDVENNEDETTESRQEEECVADLSEIHPETQTDAESCANMSEIDAEMAEMFVDDQTPSSSKDQAVNFFGTSSTNEFHNSPECDQDEADEDKNSQSSQSQCSQVQSRCSSSSDQSPPFLQEVEELEYQIVDELDEECEPCPPTLDKYYSSRTAH